MEKEFEKRSTTKAASSFFLKIHPNDNVLVALKDLAMGTKVSSNGSSFNLPENVPAKHKFFEHDMRTGDDVIMYGVLVGRLQSNVFKGQPMTTANTKHAAGQYAYRSFRYHWEPPDVADFLHKTFNGYKRSDGRVGTANYWLFIPTVFCENRNLDVIKEAMWNELGYAVTDRYKRFTKQMLQAHMAGDNIDNIDLTPTSLYTERYFKNVDGIKFLNHAGGCGGTRQDAATLSTLLASYADHPNVGGVTVVSLGCQHLQVKKFFE